MAEKPVINEKFDSDSFNGSFEWDFPRLTSAKNSPHGKNSKPTKTEDAAQNVAAHDISDENKLSNALARGMRLYLLKRWEQSLEEFLQAEPESYGNEERAELAYYIGLCCTKLERYEEALLYFEQVITIDESPIRAYQCRMILAYIYIVTGQAGMAEAELKRLEDGGLESAMLYNTLAYAAYDQKHYLAAIEYYEKALDIDKDNLTAMNGLGYVLADTGLDKLKGLRLCRKAVDKNPENAAYMDSVGWAAYQCGKIPEARKWLRQALDAAPQQKEIARHFRIASGGVI